MSFDFRHNDVNDEETKEEHRNDPFASLSLLTEIAEALNEAIARFKEGNLSLFSEVCLSKDLWDAINYARLWPEAHHDKINHLLHDALSRVSDAHFMIEGVYCSDPEDMEKRYKNAFRNINVNMRGALGLINEARDLLHDYINSIAE